MPSFQAIDGAGHPIGCVFKPISNQNITTGASTARVAANFSGNATVVRIVATANAYVAFGSATVEAATTDLIVAAGVESFFAIPAGAVRVAALQVTAAGVVSVTEMR